MKKKSIILTGHQWIGVGVLLILLAIIFVGLHFLPHPETPASSADTLKTTIQTNKKHYYDSLRIIRTARYDSLRLVRRDSLHQVYVAHRDSVKKVDSLWWDSVYQAQPKSIKRDTIIELNSADTTDLKKIRGIGSSMAKRIVRYRSQLGGYTHVEQLLDNELYLDQYGHSIRSKYCIPDSVLDCFTVCMDSVKTISVNRSSIERLQAHPYISHTLAKEIYTYRRQHVKITRLEELQPLPHMNDSLYTKITPYLNLEL